ncbi:ABC transporter substrate-binding protein [Cesiribacter sp. SM1]|uniref:ABC transporter substrate-binding protein n=1 Tax=Cesiribacter sp. SM1 TaxID=2861196 RepID=UPI001CD6DC0F|nr:ABC transporter substrate-binding protein [Cesiribacter sp. SM1]
MKWNYSTGRISLLLPLILSLVLTHWSCRPERSEKETSELSNSTAAWHRTQTEYAQTFELEYGDGYKLIHVKQPYPGATRPYTYLLLPHGQPQPDSIMADAVVRVPVQRIISLSTTHLPALDMLGESDKLTGFAQAGFISSPAQRSRLEQGALTDIGSTQGLNPEQILSLQPDLIMAYGMGPDDGTLQVLDRTGVPVLLNADFLETSPLGRAEWIKFTGALLNKEREADSVFQQIVHRYDSLKSLTQNVAQRPEVFSGIVYGDIWYVPGGKSWAAQFLADAGASYLWSDTEASGSVPLSFEQVFAKAHDAPYWINTADFSSLQALTAADERYKRFRAWQQEQVYTYTNKINNTGGNEYLELGYARPDMVLADLIKILHPELMEGHELYFYKRLPLTQQ